nr:hypothetical protein [Tanacetum cinerariifolium]
MHTAQDDSLLGTMRFVSRHEDTQVYGVILPKAMMNQTILDSIAYKTYYDIASGAEPPKSKKSQKKSDSAISSEESPSKKKPASKPKPTKKKVSVKADRGKGVLDEQQRKISGTDEGTCAKLGVPDVPKYDFESDKESWGDSAKEDDDDEDDTEYDEGNDDGDDSDGNDDDDNDGDDNDGHDDDSDHERTKSDRDENPNLIQFNEEHKEKEEEENVDEFTDKEDDKENEKEVEQINTMSLKSQGFEQEKEDAHVTLTNVHDTQKTKGPMKSSSVSSDFTEKLLNFENVSPADNEIASLMDTTVRHEEPSGQTFTLFTIPITVIPTTMPPPPHFFNPLPQQTTPNPTPTASEVTTIFPALPDFASVFRFNDRVTNLEKDLLEMKQVDQYAVIRLDQCIIKLPFIINSTLAVLITESSQSRQHGKSEPIPSVLIGSWERIPNPNHLITLNHQGRQVIPQDYFIDNNLEYLKGGSLSRQYSTSITKTKAATYEIKWIEDMVPNLWSPVKIDERCDLNVALRMFTKRIIIQMRVEDLQLGVESYQKKLNLTKPETFRSNLRNRTAYTTYLDPQGVIYKDQKNINRLLRTGELYKFSDGTLNDVQTALHDITSGIRMEYLPKRKLSRLDKRRACVMIQDIDKQLIQRRLM